MSNERVIGRSPEVVLKDAAALLERSGWCQDFLRDSGGRMCVLGAVFKTTIDNPLALVLSDEERAPAAAAIALLHQRLGAPESPYGNRGQPAQESAVAVWNNAKGRTLTEVLSMLRGEQS